MKNSPEWKNNPTLPEEPEVGSYLTPLEESYLESRPDNERLEVYNGQDAWDEILGADNRPAAAKLNEMLEHIREVGYKGESLDMKFRGCQEHTKQKQPRDFVV